MPYENGAEIRGDVITADQNNYAPGGPAGGWVDVVKVALLRGDADRLVTGFLSPQVNNDAAYKTVINVGNFNITLKFRNAGSTPGNKIYMAGGLDIVLAPIDAAIIYYDFFTLFFPEVVTGGWRAFKL